MKYVVAIASLLLTATHTPALAQITSAPDSTNTGVNQAGNTFNITGGTQAGSNLFHSFQQFGLNAGQIANFLSNPAIANILGRVTGGDASIINGRIQVTGSNANLYLMNPAGIVFGANASLNVPGSFTATTANAIGVGNNWFNAVGTNNYAVLVGTPNSFAFTGSQPGAIINAGNLAVGTGQSLTLLGGTVINTGTLTAPGGTITIAAIPGEKLVRITQNGSLLSLDLPVAVKATLNPSTGTPLSLPALLTGSNLGNATGVSVDANGIVRLTGSNTVIPSETGTAIASNQLNAAGVTGGKVAVLGQKVGLVGATIDASGTNGGGTVLVGGDYQGKGAVLNAQHTYVSPDSMIRVDAVQTGNGGRAIVWADGTTQFYGNISARGGSQSGNGGFVEVSGKTNLHFDGVVNLDAANGLLGKLLLDPETIRIVSGAAANDVEVADGTIFRDEPGGSPAGVTFTISQAALEALTGDIILEATNDIIIESLITSTSFQNPRLELYGSTITFRAGRTFSMNPTHSIAAASITIEANQIVAGNLTTSVGVNQGVRLSAGGNIEVTTIDAGPIVQISAGGTFRATGTLFIGENNRPSTDTKTVDLRDDPDLFNFLLSQGVPENALRDSVTNEILNIVIPVVRNVPTSIRAHPDNAPAQIIIQHAGESLPIQSSTAGSVAIQGNGGTTPFVSGGQVTTPVEPKFEVVKRGNLDTFDPNNQTFQLRDNRFYRALQPSEFPQNVSGTAGTIAIAASNYSLISSTQARPFVAPAFNPVNPNLNAVDRSAESTSTPVNISANRVDPNIARLEQGGQVVQRQLNRPDQSSVCNSSTTIASSTIPETRSPDNTRNPCTTTKDEAQILKILGDDAGDGKGVR